MSYTLSPIPYPLSPIPYPLTLFPLPISVIPYPLSFIPCPFSLIPFPISHKPHLLSLIPSEPYGTLKTPRLWGISKSLVSLSLWSIEMLIHLKSRMLMTKHIIILICFNVICEYVVLCPKIFWSRELSKVGLSSQLVIARHVVVVSSQQ